MLLVESPGAGHIGDEALLLGGGADVQRGYGLAARGPVRRQAARVDDPPGPHRPLARLDPAVRGALNRHPSHDAGARILRERVEPGDEAPHVHPHHAGVVHYDVFRSPSCDEPCLSAGVDPLGALWRRQSHLVERFRSDALNTAGRHP